MSLREGEEAERLSVATLPEKAASSAPSEESRRDLFPNHVLKRSGLRDQSSKQRDRRG